MHPPMFLDEEYNGLSDSKLLGKVFLLHSLQSLDDKDYLNIGSKILESRVLFVFVLGCFTLWWRVRYMDLIFLYCTIICICFYWFTFLKISLCFITPFYFRSFSRSFFIYLYFGTSSSTIIRYCITVVYVTATYPQWTLFKGSN